jgi:hypothetical protein
LWKKDDNLIISDNKWNLELLEVTTINSRTILNYIKSNDCSWCFDSYDLRNEIMHIDHSVKSFDAFTKWDIPKWKYESKNYLTNKDNWLTKRVELHDMLYDKYYKEAIEMSERLWNNNPRVICMRWNTAVWKTYTLKHLDKNLLSKYPLIDNSWNPTWALNPDIIKSSIRNFDRSWNIEIVNEKMAHTITDCQAHIEWWIINDRIIRKLFEEKRSLVLDKRFVDKQSIEQTVLNRMWLDYSLTIIDIWWDFRDSLERAYNRDIYWNDPIVPYEQIEIWHVDITLNRDLIAKMKECNEYYLFYKWDIVAHSINWNLKRHDFLAYEKLITLETKSEINKLRKEFKDKITDKVLNWR